MALDSLLALDGLYLYWGYNCSVIGLIGVIYHLRGDVQFALIHFWCNFIAFLFNLLFLFTGIRAAGNWRWW